MGQVRITLNGRGYDIACDDGQEEHVMRLANALSERVNQLVTANGQVGEARLLLMARRRRSGQSSTKLGVIATCNVRTGGQPI